MKYWLIKSEPTSYSITDLEHDKKTAWTGVRNYQARNFMRDAMEVGDKILFYHSNTEPSGVAGVAEVCSKPYPDPTAFDKKSPYYDPDSTPDNPRWMLVDVAFVKKFARPVPLTVIKNHPVLQHMMVAKPGMRLSVQPVEAHHFELLADLGK